MGPRSPADGVLEGNAKPCDDSAGKKKHTEDTGRQKWGLAERIKEDRTAGESVDRAYEARGTKSGVGRQARIQS